MEPTNTVMTTYNEEHVLAVHHWNDAHFSFRTTRRAGFRFHNGQFAMIGLEVAGRPLLRAYSMASANYDEHLEFYSIKVPGGALTSRLQHVVPGQPVLVGHKPTGTLLLDNLTPGKRLFLLATGTGLAPFLSILHDPQIYERFETVVLAHGVRRVSDLGYRRYIEGEVHDHELVGSGAKKQLLYYPTVTREPFLNQGRISDLLTSNKLTADLGQRPLEPEQDRVMLCGSPSMLSDLRRMLDDRGFGEPGEDSRERYLFERAFAATS
jgi:ferredoxin--NADP+ reductase